MQKGEKTVIGKDRFNPKSLDPTLTNIQLWSSEGTLVTALYKIDDAKKDLKARIVFVISDQACGIFDKRYHILGE